MNKYKITNIVIFILSSLVFSYTKVSLSFNDLTVAPNGNNVHFSGYNLASTPGEPILPIYSCEVLVHPDADLSTITANFIESEEVDIVGDFKIAPGTPLCSNDKTFYAREKKRADEKYAAIYKSNNFFPATNIKDIHVGKMRSYKIVNILISPVRYNPVNGNLKHLIEGELVINYELEKNRSYSLHDMPNNFRDIAKSLTINFSEASGEYHNRMLNKRQTSTKLLIVTTNEVKSNLSYFDNFVEIKKAKGFDVEVITENTYNDGSVGLNAALSLRAWLKENVESKGIEYILLIGPPGSFNETTGKMPMKLADPDNYHVSLTDNFYAELSGDWDLNGDGNYGTWLSDLKTGGCDKYAEVHIGRISCYNNDYATVSKILERTNNYETASKDSVAWRKSAILPLTPFDATQNGKSYGEYLKKTVLEPNNFSSFTIYDAGGDLSPNSFSATVSSWNSGKYGISQWQGHGLATFATDAISTETAAQLNDDYPSFCFSLSCHNGKPEVSNNVCYAVLKNQAIGALGSSVQTLYGSGSTYGNGGRIHDFGYLYAKNLIDNSLTAGAAWTKCKSEASYQFISTAWLHACEVNVYGDPTIGLESFGKIQTVSNKTLLNNNQGNLKLNTVARNGNLFLMLSNERHEGGNIKIFSLLGQLIYQKRIDKNEKQICIDKTISKGCFIIKSDIKDISMNSIMITNKLIIN